MKFPALSAIAIKSAVFTVITVLATVVLASTIRNSASPGAVEHSAIFADVTSLNLGDDIRMAGVKIGTVKKIAIQDNRLAKVTFTVAEDAPLTTGTTAQLKFRNLVGQRYISLEPPEGGGSAKMSPGATFTLDQTRPALDLTTLFNGFQPLMKFLSPEDVNALSGEIIAVFQGEGATVESLLSSTASLTSTLAQRDQIIGELITNLTSVAETVNSKSDQLDSTVITLQRLVSGLADDRETLGNTIEGMGELTTTVSELLREGRPPLKRSIASLGALSGNLADSEDTLDRFFETLPVKLDQIGRLSSYGSWLNFYECEITGVIPNPEGYRGDLGAKPIAPRCKS